MRFVQSKQRSKHFFAIIITFVWSAVFSGNVLAVGFDGGNSQVNGRTLVITETQATRSKTGHSGGEVVADDFHSGQTSWHSVTPESALKLIGTFDLSAATAPQVTFWHKFDLPSGSIGTVELSADNGLTWTPVYTQTAPLTAWTEASVDLTPYAGEQISLAFYLHDIGEVEANAVNSVAQSNIPTTPFTNYLFLSILPLGGVALLFTGRKRRYGLMLGM